jgi:hypothetical protein
MHAFFLFSFEINPIWCVPAICCCSYQMVRDSTEMFFWQMSSEFVILVPIQNSTWLLESVVQFDWLRFKTLFFKNYTVV